MLPPHDASITVQRAFLDQDKRIKTLESLVGHLRSLTNIPYNIEKLSEQITALSTQRKPEESWWEDLRFPSGGFNPVGSTAPPSVSTSTGLLVFSGAADNIISGVAQMPHAWRVGSYIIPHIHLRFPTSVAANTRWKFEYDIGNVTGNFTNNSGTLTDGGTITVANPQNVKKHEIANFANVTMTGFGISTIILWKLSRLAASDGADTDTNAVEFLEFDIHYQQDSMGSFKPTSK